MKTLRGRKGGRHGPGGESSTARARTKRRIMDMGITQGRGGPRAEGGPPGGAHGTASVRGYELSVRKADAEMIEIA